MDRILNLFGLKVIRPMKHESKMTNQELIYHYEWAINIGFGTMVKDFLRELEKRGLVKKN